MKQRNWHSKMLAIVCSFVLVISSIGIQAFADTGNGVASLKKLTFSHFGLDDNTYSSISGTYDNGASLINKKISGYLTLNQNLTSVTVVPWMVLGTSGGWEGIQFQFQNNGTQVYVNTGSVTADSGYAYLFDVANITSLNSFAGERFKFTLSLEATDLDGGGTDNDVLMKFYVNDELCVANKTWADSANGTYGTDGSYYILNAKTDKLNGYLKWQQLGGTGQCSNVALESCTLTKIPFSDFGLSDNTYTSVNGVYKEGASLIDSEISGYLTLNQNLTSASLAPWLVFGTSGGWEGIQFQFQNNGTQVYVNTGSVTADSGYAYLFDVANITSLNSFAGERFKFTLSLEATDLDGGGTDNDVLMKFYVNDELCVANKTWADSANGTYGTDGSYYILNAKTDKLNGYLKSQQIGGANQCSNIVIENENSNEGGGEGGDSQEPVTLTPLTGYTGMSFTHFGYEEVTRVCGVGTDQAERTETASSETLHKVLVDGCYNITKGGNYIYFGGTWKGIRLFVDDAGDMQIIHVDSAGAVSQMGSITTSETEFNLHGREDLRIQTAFTLSNPEGDTTDVTVIVRLDEIYEEEFTVSNVPTNTLLQKLHVWSLNGNCPITLTSVEIPPSTLPTLTGYKGMSFTHFGYEEVTRVCGVGTDQAERTESASGETLHKVLVDGYYNITKGGNYIYFGGTWKGIRLFVGDNGDMQIIHVDSAGKVSEMGSITTSETEFDLHGREDLRIQTAFTLSNPEGDTTDVTLIVRLDEIYEETFTVSNVPVNTLLQTLHVWSLNGNCPITLTSVEIVEEPSDDITDIELYNLAESTKGYMVLGKGTLTVNGKGVTNGYAITIPGDYVVRCSGEGAYAKKVVLYKSGDAHPDGVLDVKDLVAAKKVSGEVEVDTKAGMEGADVDRNDMVDDKDLGSVRSHLVGKTELVATKNNYLSYEEDVMPIAGYFGPYNATDAYGKTYTLLTDDVYTKIKNAGINLICSTNRNYADETHQQDILDGLALASKHDIGVFVMQNNVRGNSSDADIAHMMKEFAQYSAFKGITLCDEPTTTSYGADDKVAANNSMISQYATASTALNNFSNTFAYTNLYPMKDYLNQTSSDDKTVYSAYVDEYLNTCNPRLLSWDRYLYYNMTSSNKKTTYQNYFTELSMMREKALAKGIPFWTYVQAGDNFNDEGDKMYPATSTTPTKGQLFWNVNTALAYGAKGIQYFPLVQPYWYTYERKGYLDSTLVYDYTLSGLLGADGSINALWYDSATEANQQVALVDEVLMNATSKMVLWTGTDATTHIGTAVTSDGAILKSITTESSKSAIVGVFEYHGKTAYYVVNYDDSSARTVTLNFYNSENYTVTSNQLSSAHTATSGTSCTLQLQAGGAALVIIDK